MALNVPLFTQVRSQRNQVKLQPHLEYTLLPTRRVKPPLQFQHGCNFTSDLLILGT
jgi:hypothetical protein